MEIYILILSFFIFSSSFFISIKLEKEINAGSITFSFFTALFISFFTYLGIRFLNSEPYDSIIKISVITILISTFFVLLRISLINNVTFLKNNNLKIDFYFNLFFTLSLILAASVSNFPAKEVNIFYLSLIILMLSFILTKAFILTIIIIIYNIYDSGKYSALFIIAAYFIVIFIFKMITSLKLTFLNKLFKNKVNDINYNFLKEDTYNFFSKFKITSLKEFPDYLIFNYKDELESINFFIKFNIKEKFNSILKENNYKVFLLNTNLLGSNINISFSDLQFYCSYDMSVSTLDNLSPLEVNEDTDNIEEFLKQKFKINYIFNY